MTNPIPLGVWGIGRIGGVHCRHFSAEPEKYRLVAVCDRDAARLAAVSEQYDCAAYEDEQAFLDDPGTELVVVATRSMDHAAHASRALAAGKTVLLEKPIGVTADDYRCLRQLVRDYPGKLYFLHNHRFEPAFTQARSIVASGLVGEVHVVKLCKHHAFMRRNDWQMRLDCGGGQLSVWGPHLIDQGLRLLGAPVRDVWSYLRRVLTPGDGDDYVKINLLGENDVAVEIEISNSAAVAAPYCTIHGDRGTLTYGQAQTDIRLKYLAPDFRWPEVAAETGTPKGLNADPELPWIEETRPVEPDTNMWQYVEIALVNHLHDALRNQVPFPVTADDALEVVRITEIVKQQNPQFDWIG